MNVLISTKPFIICLEAVQVGITVRSAVSLSAAIPLGTSTKRADFLKEQNLGRFASDEVVDGPFLWPEAARLPPRWRGG